MNLIEWTDQLRFLVAIALGFLVGLERESRGNELASKLTAGVRTLYSHKLVWIWMCMALQIEC